MPHPKDRSGLTRGQLLRGAAVAAAGVGVAGGLVGCENTTEPVAVGCETGRGGLAARRPEAGRPGRAAAPAHRQQRHVGDRRRQPDDRRRPAARDREHAPPLQLPGLHLPRAAAPLREALRLQGRGRHLQRLRRGDRQAPVGRRRVRRHPRALGLEHRQPDGAAAPAAAEPHVPAEPGREHLAAARRPVLRPRLALHGALRHLVGRHRLAERPDLGRHPGARRALGHLLGVRGVARQGRAPRRQARRPRDAHAARRADRGSDRRPEHGGPGDRRQGGRGPPAADRHLQHQGDDHRLPDAARGDDVPPPLLVGRPPRRRHPVHAARRPARRPLLLVARDRRRRAERLPLRRQGGGKPRSRPPVPRLHARRDGRLRELHQLERLPAAAERHRRRRAHRGRFDPRDPRDGGHPPGSSSSPTRSCSSSPSRASGSGTRPGRRSGPARGPR